MKTIAVIAEYNPFHLGHQYLLTAIRQHVGNDASLAIIMSGAFVQRGEPALFDKWTRAAWALRHGADVVIELPLVYAVSSANGFASGAVRLAAKLGCDTIACGVETGTAAAFRQLAQEATTIRDLPIQNHQGQPYGQYVTEALRQRCPDQQALLDSPNSLLALEYTKAIVTYAPHMELLPIRRLGTTHDAPIVHCAFASASALRTHLRTLDIEAIKPYVPADEYTDIVSLVQQGQMVSYDRYHDLVLYANRITPPTVLQTYPAFTEGLENRWHRVYQQAPTWDEAMAALKTRRYSYSRLCRMGVYTTLRLPRTIVTASYTDGPQYARILAVAPRGRALLKGSKKRIPIVTKVATDMKKLSPLRQEQFYYDCLGTDLQALSMQEPAYRQGRQDYTHSPYIISSCEI